MYIICACTHACAHTPLSTTWDHRVLTHTQPLPLIHPQPHPANHSPTDTLLCCSKLFQYTTRMAFPPHANATCECIHDKVNVIVQWTLWCCGGSIVGPGHRVRANRNPLMPIVLMVYLHDAVT